MVFWIFETRFEGSKVVFELCTFWKGFENKISKYSSHFQFWDRKHKIWPFKQPIDGFKWPPNGMCNMTLERYFLWLQLCSWKYLNWNSYVRIVIPQKKKTHNLIIKKKLKIPILESLQFIALQFNPHHHS
jgi:hypothetical protein